MQRHRPCSIVAFAACLSCALPASAARVETENEVADAIWRVQEFDFHFRTSGRYHSCTSLHSKITAILREIGAGEVVVQLACAPNSLTNNTFARVATATPVQASTQNIEAATTYDSRQQLTARLRQIQLPSAADIDRFPAQWREVTLSNNRRLQLGRHDCDLLQDLTRQILPHLSVRIVRKRLNCGSPTLDPANPVLVVSALVKRAT